MKTNTELRFPSDAELIAEIATPVNEEYSSEVSNVIMNAVCAPDDEND